MSKDDERKRITEAIREGKDLECCGFEVNDNAKESTGKKKCNI